MKKYEGQFEEVYYGKLLSLLIGNQDKEKTAQLAKRINESQEKYLKEDGFLLKRKYLGE